MAAGVPVAVWQDRDGEIDCRNYAGLPVISTAGGWWDFATAAERNRDELVAKQEDFIRCLNIPGDVKQRYASLLSLSG